MEVGKTRMCVFILSFREKFVAGPLEADQLAYLMFWMSDILERQTEIK